MLRYIFSLLMLLGLFQHGFSQNERIKGIRLGYDVSRLFLYYSEPERAGQEFSVDFEVKTHIYSAVEYGIQNVSIEHSLYNYQSHGNYIRVGVEKNFLQKIALNQYEMVFGGFRYGYSSYTHSADNITIRDDYWGDYTNGSIPETSASAHWLELVGGIKGEIFTNFFIGWSFRAKFLLHQTKNNAIEPYDIPGFGPVDNKSNIGFTYSIYYRIPLYKVDVN